MFQQDRAIHQSLSLSLPSTFSPGKCYWDAMHDKLCSNSDNNVPQGSECGGIKVIEWELFSCPMQFYGVQLRTSLHIAVTPWRVLETVSTRHHLLVRSFFFLFICSSAQPISPSQHMFSVSVPLSNIPNHDLSWQGDISYSGGQSSGWDKAYTY